MKKSQKPNQEDLESFQQAIKGTKPLACNKIRLKKTSPLLPRGKTKEAHQEYFNFVSHENLPEVSGEEQLTFKHESVSNKILRKLHKGQYNVDAILDLHGKTIEKARISLDQFLFQCLRNKAQVVLVIHGKGSPTKRPILKNQLNNWLRQTSIVLAFCSAMAAHGGSGATYVLLKKHTGEEA